MHRRVLDDLTTHEILQMSDHTLLIGWEIMYRYSAGFACPHFLTCRARSARVWHVVQADSGVLTSPDSPPS
jgi:hypothetical protein